LVFKREKKTFPESKLKKMISHVVIDGGGSSSQFWRVVLLTGPPDHGGRPSFILVLVRVGQQWKAHWLKCNRVTISI
jgi:hypothetical protein